MRCVSQRGLSSIPDWQQMCISNGMHLDVFDFAILLDPQKYLLKYFVICFSLQKQNMQQRSLTKKKKNHCCSK